jgi:acyl carrier protein
MSTAPMPHTGGSLDTAAIERLVMDAMRATNLARQESSQLEVTPDAAVFGPGSPLDSLGLVALLLDIEEAFQAAGHPIVLSDERAVSQKRSPFRNVRSLVDYISPLVQGA